MKKLLGNFGVFDKYLADQQNKKQENDQEVKKAFLLGGNIKGAGVAVYGKKKYARH
tara:strand:+ start:2410 stop:2577 length:168 start_codon:yes stop_codon:yes gene_type:complete